MKRSSPERNGTGFFSYWKKELEKLSSTHILHWAVDAYYPRLALQTSFDPEGCVLLSMLSEIVPKITIYANAVDGRMRHFRSVAAWFRVKTELEIELVRFHAGETRGRLPFDALLCGTRHDGEYVDGGVLRMDQSLEIPAIAPLIRWTGDAITAKLREDAIIDSLFIGVWGRDG